MKYFKLSNKTNKLLVCSLCNVFLAQQKQKSDSHRSIGSLGKQNHLKFLSSRMNCGLIGCLSATLSQEEMSEETSHLFLCRCVGFCSSDLLSHHLFCSVYSLFFCFNHQYFRLKNLNLITFLLIVAGFTYVDLCFTFDHFNENHVTT